MNSEWVTTEIRKAHHAELALGAGRFPKRGCGVSEDFITYLPSLIGTMQPIQYQSCFISDRSRDEEFARRLHEKRRGDKLRVWFAPEDMQGGQYVAVIAPRDEPSVSRLPTANPRSRQFEDQTQKARHAER